MKFLDCVGASFGKISRASVKAGKVVVTDVENKILHKFATKKEMEDHVAALEFWK